MHCDRYRNFDELAASEDASAFRIDAKNRNSSICVLAPHGGKIEPGTSDLARAVAGSHLSYYLFGGRKPKDNRDLHVTSSNFNEPQAIAIVESSDVALAMHGCEGDDEVIYLGGRHEKLAANIAKALSNRGFSVGTHKNPALQGTAEKNICNRAKLGMGVQFEITRALRVRLTDKTGQSTTPSLDDFVDAINEGLSQ